MPPNSNNRRIQAYLTPKNYAMFKAWADINDHNDSKGINEVFKFFMQQFSEHDKQLFLEHFKTMRPRN